jgi:hypothetical protein
VLGAAVAAAADGVRTGTAKGSWKSAAQVRLDAGSDQHHFCGHRSNLYYIFVHYIMQKFLCPIQKAFRLNLQYLSAQLRQW